MLLILQGGDGGHLGGRIHVKGLPDPVEIGDHSGGSETEADAQAGKAVDLGEGS